MGGPRAGAGSRVRVAIPAVGVGALALEACSGAPGAAAVSRAFGAAYPGCTLLAGIDSCQRLSGCALKLLAPERLLEENAVYRQRVVPVQRCEKAGQARG